MATKRHTINVRVVAYKKSEYWIAFIPALKTFGYSKVSEAAALDDLDRAVETFVWAQETQGTLHIALENLGWKLVDSTIEQPKHFNRPLGELLPGRGNARTLERAVTFPAA